MKTIKIFALALAAVCVMGCEDFINDIPKGQKIPTTWADFNAFIKNNYTYHQFEQDHLLSLVGDMFRNPTTVTSPSLNRTHYFSDESVNRLEQASDKNPYSFAYEAIFAWNLIVDQGPKLKDCTPQERDMLVAQARVLRVMGFFYLTNYYADQYCEATLNKPSVPLVTSANVEAPSPQVSLKEMYDFMMEDLLLAVDHLPAQSEDILHPNKALGYGMLARVALSMGDYTAAQGYAEQALAQNDALFDWIGFYNADKARFDAPSSYSSGTLTNPELQNPENYIYRLGSMTGWSGLSNVSYALPEDRAGRFEPGDTRLITHWKRRASASGLIFYAGIYANERNNGGMRAAEMYYIKAECLARAGKLQEAMDVVNKVRKTRILPEYYQAWTAPASVQEAVNRVLDDKFNEFVQTMVPYWDLRRINKDPQYARTITKVIGGQTYTMGPNSHLWIMPFPPEVISNPGNDPIVQNVDK